MLDKALVEALGEVVSEAGQPKSVARRLMAWLTRMSEGELPREDHERFLKDVCNAIVMETGDED